MSFCKKLLFICAIFISVNAFSQTLADDNNTGAVLYDDGKYAEALKYHTSAILADSTIAESYYLRGKCYFMLEDDASAIKDYNRSIKLDPNKKEVYYMRGQSKGFMGDLNGASADYYSAIMLDSNYVDPYIKRANVFIQQGQLMPAFVYFSIAIKKHYNPPADLYFGRGYCHQQLGSYQQAIEDYKKAIELNPKYTDPYLNLANTYLTIKEYGNAIEAYNKALELLPNDYRVFIGRAYAYYYTNELEKACIDRKKALDLGYKDTTNLFGDYCNKK